METEKAIVKMFFKLCMHSKDLVDRFGLVKSTRFLYQTVDRYPKEEKIPKSGHVKIMYRL